MFLEVCDEQTFISGFMQETVFFPSIKINPACLIVDLLFRYVKFLSVDTPAVISQMEFTPAPNDTFLLGRSSSSLMQ